MRISRTKLSYNLIQPRARCRDYPCAAEARHQAKPCLSAFSIYFRPKAVFLLPQSVMAETLKVQVSICESALPLYATATGAKARG